MLSRIAESLFWIGRYVERADDTARILDVHIQRLLEDPWIDEARACRVAARAHGRRRRPRPAGRHRARCSTLLAFDRTSPSSIVGALVRRPGERPRRPRGDLGARSGSALNVTWQRAAAAAHDGRAGIGPHSLFSATSASARRWSSGWPTSTMSRDEAGCSWSSAAAWSGST